MTNPLPAVGSSDWYAWAQTIDSLARSAESGGLNTEQVQDIVAAMFASGSHSGITFTYNDTAGSLSATVAGGTGGTGDTGGIALTDNGDGTFQLSGTGVTDHLDGTFQLSGTAVADNGNGTYTIAA